MNNLLHTPDGVRDIYDKDYLLKFKTENMISEVFHEAGYKDIKTPTLEYYDVFGDEVGTTPRNNLFKFDDRNGDTVVLRPDFTPSIARCAAKYFMENDETLRFTYKGDTFSQTASLQGKLVETTQMGVELIGENEVWADAEVLNLSIKALLATGLNHFNVTIGNIEYFKGLCEELGFDEETELALRDLITNKNFFGARKYLEDIKAEETVIEKICKLDMLIGGKNVLNEAEKLTTNPRSKAAISHLRELSLMLEKKGYGEYIYFDLSMLNKYMYYTGVVFKAYTYGVGDCILKGGRYDNLLGKFGKEAPAIGFVIMIDDLISALSSPKASEKSEYLTFALTKGRRAKKTLELLEQLGITCDEMKEDTRKLIFVNEELKLKFFLAKGPDVPTYVEYGAADIGVVGKDTIMEEDRRVYEVLDLGFGKCRMCVCGPKSAEELLKHHDQIRVCTKYPAIAKNYFYNEKNQTVELIKLNGSVELGPIVGLGDVIVDIVETGSTLRENGLDVLEEICPLSARMIVNQVSMQMQPARIKELIAKLREIISED